MRMQYLLHLSSGKITDQCQHKQRVVALPVAHEAAAAADAACRHQSSDTGGTLRRPRLLRQYHTRLAWPRALCLIDVKNSPIVIQIYALKFDHSPWIPSHPMRHLMPHVTNHARQCNAADMCSHSSRLNNTLLNVQSISVLSGSGATI